MLAWRPTGCSRLTSGLKGERFAMEIHQLRYFRAVAQCGSFTRAAKREHVSQPSLSHQVMKLEDELGARLFNRKGHLVDLTPFGEAFLPKIESVLQQLQDAQTQIREMAKVEKVRKVVERECPCSRPESGAGERWSDRSHSRLIIRREGRWGRQVRSRSERDKPSTVSVRPSPRPSSR
jgi:molybdenum-dependent DNA-binding transcriptional regulator ModE